MFSSGETPLMTPDGYSSISQGKRRYLPHTYLFYFSFDVVATMNEYTGMWQQLNWHTIRLLYNLLHIRVQ